MNVLQNDVSTLSAADRRQLLGELLRQRDPQPDCGPAEQLCVGRRQTGFHTPPDFLERKRAVEALEDHGANRIYFNASAGVNGNVTQIGEREYINYCSYNYLGLSGDLEVSEAAKLAIDRYGTSVSASRIVSGERPIHRELEEEIARFLGVDDSIVFVGGFGTNETVVGHLFGPDDLILYDSLIHASVLAGARLSGAKIRPFPHNQWRALDKILDEERSRYSKVLVVIEGVYSMDGDIPELPRFIEIKHRHDAWLMIDEAHSLGVIGKRGQGIGEFYEVDRTDVDIWMGTLSKSLASCGGYIAGSRELIEYCRYTVPGFVFSVGLSPALAASALAALRILRREPQRVGQLQQRARTLLDAAKQLGCDTGTAQGTAVIPIIVGNTEPCVRLFRFLQQRGVLALPVLHPFVPEGTARLRFFLSSTHTVEQIRQTIDTLREAIERGVMKK